jgi:Rrf2 family transcriptional regulator, nitric oxide-sensitive transcriptional repressor
MLINRKVDYALRVLIHLTENTGKTTTGELAEKLKVSRLFLAKIVNQLSKCGIISSERGKTGGITLKDPKTSVKTVILMFDPKFAFNKCLQKGHTCFLGSVCPMHCFLQEAQDDLMEKLGALSIEGLVKRGVN